MKNRKLRSTRFNLLCAAVTACAAGQARSHSWRVGRIGLFRQLRWLGLKHRCDAYRLRQIIASDFAKRVASLGMLHRAPEASLRHHQIEERRFSLASMDRLALH